MTKVTTRYLPPLRTNIPTLAEAKHRFIHLQFRLEPLENRKGASVVGKPLF